MNFLSHHAVARRVAAQEPSLFYAGNLAPDWMGMSREATLKAQQVEGKSGALVEGIQLHLATDKQFHGDATFDLLCKEASALLTQTAFEVPLKRVFFYGHVAVELALDAVLLRREPNLAADLFTHLASCLPQIAPETARLVELPELPRLAALVDGFVRSRWILTYATDEGLARRLSQLGQRIGHAPLSDTDQAQLAIAFTALRERVAPEADGLIHRSGFRPELA